MKTNETFRADFAGCSVLLGILSIPFLIHLLVLAKFGWGKFVADGMLEAAAISLALPALWAFWLSRFRLTFEANRLTYRPGFGRPWSTPYSTITAVTQSRMAPISRLPLSAWVQLGDGQRKLINLKVFPASAGLRLFQIQSGSTSSAA
jgi:hypothetical protein